MSKDPVRRIRLRAVVAYPAVALVAALALAITPLSPAQGMTLAVLPTPTDTLAAAAVPTTADATTAAPTSVPTTDVPTSVPTTDATALTPTSGATTVPVPNPTPGVDPSLAPALTAPVAHHVLARVGDGGLEATYLAVDAPVLDGSQFQTFRVRFQLRNDGAETIAPTPQLEYRADGAAGFKVVPQAPQLASPLHIAREWVPSAGGGTKQGLLEDDIAPVDFKLPVQAGEAVVGHHSMGANPDVPITMPAAAYTEQEFTVRLSMDAQYLTGYELRVTDAGTALSGSTTAKITLGTPPQLQLSPGQRDGVAVVDPTATGAADAAYPLFNATAVASEPPSAPLAAPATSPSAVDYPLASASPSPATTTLPSPATAAEPAPAAVEPATPAAVSVASTAIHGPYDMTSGQCATCHSGHAAQGPTLIAKSDQSTLCFTCHDGGGAKDVKSPYTDLLLPKNDATEREYFSHDATAPTSTHTQSGDVSEFKDVLNRHSECTDCHNPHKANDSIESAPTVGGNLAESGWSASGRLAGVSGVSVVNGAAGEAPQYTFLSGVTDDINEEVPVASLRPVTLEYQLCFKCHSGFTKLTDNAGLAPSKYALDKAVEFNPANPSFHPVEAAGKNDTAKMTDSLAGTSPYKLWNFNTTSTVRCLNCHAGGASEPTATPPLPLPGSALAPHTSSNRGILLENYRDRVLKPSTAASATDAAYSAGDFALCYVCHAEAPFANQSDPADGSSNATNFKLHGLHLTGLTSKGDGGTDIDTAGAGEGNAICAECHFRIHSTTNKVEPQVIDGTRLVNFAPNVRPSGGALTWTPGITGSGSCTLTCHGYEHTARPYSE